LRSVNHGVTIKRLPERDSKDERAAIMTASRPVIMRRALLAGLGLKIRG
jgi:hypothetical protein